MKKAIRITIGVVILLVFGGTIVYLYSKSKEDPKTYKTETPFYTDIVKKTVANGSVTPRKEIEIKPQISGIIKEIFVEPGERVDENELIAKVKVVPDMVNLNSARSRVNKAEINLEDKKREFERQKKLFENGYIPKAEFEKVEVSYKNAKEELEAAKNNLQLIKEGALEKKGESSNTLIRSTTQGMVLNVPVERGNSVIESNNFNDGTTIATIADMNDMIFKGKVDESEVGRLHTGMDIILSIGALPDEEFNATLEYIAPKGNEENGAVQFEIKADVNLKDDQFIRAGYSAIGDIILQKKDSVLAVNESLLQYENDSTYVEVKEGESSYKQVNPDFGISDGINIEVKSGLSKDDKIKDPTRRQE